jgi:hypothetical protein
VAVHLGRDEPVSGGDPDGDRALAGQQQPDPAGLRGHGHEVGEILGQPGTGRRVQVGGRAVERDEPHPLLGGALHEVAVPGPEALDPALDAAGRDGDPPAAAGCRPGAHAATVRYRRVAGSAACPPTPTRS